MIIYHNPRCSKSRQTLALLRENGIEPDIVNYLKTPLSVETIDRLFDKLGDASALLMRTKEARYKELGLKGQSLNKEEMCHILAENPKLIERPIVVLGDKAVLGRPPENVLILLQD